jgi:hypothetical protein
MMKCNKAHNSTRQLRLTEVQIVEKARTLHGILDRCACQKQAIPTVKAEQGLPADASSILDILGFVEYHVLPLDPLKVLLVLGDLESSQHAS